MTRRWYHFPNLFLWHATFDGTRLCRCPRSRWIKELHTW